MGGQCRGCARRLPGVTRFPRERNAIFLNIALQKYFQRRPRETGTLIGGPATRSNRSTFFNRPIADNARGCPLRYVLGNTVIRLEAEALYSNVNRERKLVKRRQTREEKLYNNHVSRRLCPFNLRTDERGRRLLLITIN